MKITMLILTVIFLSIEYFVKSNPASSDILLVLLIGNGLIEMVKKYKSSKQKKYFVISIICGIAGIIALFDYCYISFFLV